MFKLSMRRREPATDTIAGTYEQGFGSALGASLQKIHGLRRYAATCLFTSMICAMSATSLYSQPYFEGWSPSNEYDYFGFNPSVAMYGTTVVEVHNGSDTAGPLWYRVGQVSGSTITWGSSYEYDAFGFNPSVAMDGTTVVEVHNGSGAPGPVWHHVGTISGGGLNWGSSVEYDWGWNPKIALVLIDPNYGYVLEVHNGSGSAGLMWSQLGYFFDEDYDVRFVRLRHWV